ncbi:MAG: Cobalamin biosynthesis protein CbiG [Candidatus Hodgkinia cicadicola]|nr:MAG: Cobalamin biosynthesis protein CbiG [Candidatus Hodgkinia cicadicola]
MRVPDASPVRVFEYCVKDFKRLLNAFNLFTIFERFVSFRQLARLTRQLTLVEFVKLKRFTPYLKLPTLWAQNTFSLYSVTESLCLRLNCKPKICACSADFLIRFCLITKLTFLKGLSLPPSINALANRQQVVAYFYYLRLIWTLLADIVCHNHGLTTELDRVKLVSRRCEFCLLCSGDCGVYSVLNLFLQNNNVKACCQVVAVPGVSSMQYLNIVLGSLLSSSFNTVSFSNAFDWVRLKRFVILCCVRDSVCAVYNPKACYRRRLLTYVINCGAVTFARPTVSAGKRLCTRFECVSTMFAANASLAIVSMLTIAFLCVNLILFVAYSNALSCVS